MGAWGVGVWGPPTLRLQNPKRRCAHQDSGTCAPTGTAKCHGPLGTYRPGKAIVETPRRWWKCSGNCWNALAVLEHPGDCRDAPSGRLYDHPSPWRVGAGPPGVVVMAQCRRAGRPTVRRSLAGASRAAPMAVCWHIEGRGRGEKSCMMCVIEMCRSRTIKRGNVPAFERSNGKTGSPKTGTRDSKP